MTLSQSYWQKIGTDALVRYSRTQNGVLSDTFERGMKREFCRRVDKKYKKFFPNEDFKEAYYNLKPRIQRWLDEEFPYEEDLKLVVAGYYAIMLCGIVLYDEDIKEPYRDAVTKFTLKHNIVHFL